MLKKLSALVLLFPFAFLIVVVGWSYPLKIDFITTIGEVIDGDTFHTLNDTKIRLADIDAPEYYESGFDGSRNFLASLLIDKSVYVDVDDMSRTDPYGRLVCLVLIEHNSTHFLNVNKALVDSGNARITDYRNNEFNPYTWSLYYTRNDLPTFPDNGTAVPDDSSTVPESSAIPPLKLGLIMTAAILFFLIALVTIQIVRKKVKARLTAFVQHG